MLKQKPREKLAVIGQQNLTDVELLSLLLGSGSQKLPLEQLSKRILKTFSLQSLLTVTSQELQQVFGIGKAQASGLLACIELGKRLHTSSVMPTVFSSKDVLEQTKQINNKKREYLLVLYLNARQELLTKEVVSIGGLNYTNVHPRDVFMTAVNLPAAYLILVHNHPSGNVQASHADLEVTERLVAAGELLGITILDHLIVSNASYFSFKEEGLL